MSVSFRMYSIPKTESAELQKCRTHEDLIACFQKLGIVVYDNEFCYLPDAATPIYDFGDADFCEGVWELGRPLFEEGCKLCEDFADFSPYIAGKEALEFIMRWYVERVRNCLKDLLRETSENPFHANQTQEERLVADVKDRLCRWNGEFGPMACDGENYIVTNSWLYEYAYFNLVGIYKNLDFEQNDLLFMF